MTSEETKQARIRIDAGASRNDRGTIHISLVNIDPRASSEVTIDLQGSEVSKVSGRILTSEGLADHNTFDRPDNILPAPFDGAAFKEGQLRVTLPAKSVVVLAVD